MAKSKKKKKSDEKKNSDKKETEKSDKYLDYVEKYKKNKTSYKTIKVSLAKIIKDQENVDKLQFIVNNVNQIISHTYQFLKLYCLYTLDNENVLPEINKQLVNTIMKILCIREGSSKTGRKKSKEILELKNQLEKFNLTHYQTTISEPLKLIYTQLNTVLDYETSTILTCFNNHIKEHFISFMNRYINVMIDKHQMENYIRHPIKYNCNVNEIIKNETLIKQSFEGDLQKEVLIKYLEKVVKNKQEFKLGSTLETASIKLYRKRISVIKKDIFENTDNCHLKYNDLKTKIRTQILPLLKPIDEYIDQYVNKHTNESHIQNPIKYNPIKPEIINENLRYIKQHLDGDLQKEAILSYLTNIEPNNQQDTNFNNEIRQESIRGYRKSIDKIKKDILKNANTCNIKYNDMKNDVRNNLLTKINPNDRYVDIEKNPLHYLKSMIQMNKEIESKGVTTFSCFPLRTSGIPKYIKLDTTTILYLLLPENSDIKKSSTDIKIRQDDIWNAIFNTNHKVFSDKKYKFNHSISTDGVGCSLLFIRNDLYNPTKVVKIPHMKKPFAYSEFQYVDELTDDEKAILQKLRMIGIDPGKIRLITATNGVVQVELKEDDKKKHKPIYFNYSNNQRKYEAKIIKYNEIRSYKMKHTLINGQTIEEINSSLSNHSSKSCDYKKCIEYITDKNKISQITNEFYNDWLFRKLRWNACINKRRSEDNMVNNFHKKLISNNIPSNKVVLLYGDYSESKCMKNNEPSKGKSMRRLFRNHGYNVYLVNEYNTSKKNFINGQDTETFRTRLNKSNNMQEVHGLLRSENIPNDNSRTHILLNRDYNGSMNILIKGRCIINNQPVPDYLIRH